VTANGCTIGVSWNNYQEERWAKWDEPAIKAAIAAGGGKYISNDAKSSADTQTSNVANLISQGAKVVIILAQDGTAIKPAVTAALQANVPVIAYDRLIEDPKVFYLTFDNVLVGKLQAAALLKVKSSATSSSSRATALTPMPTSCGRATSRRGCPTRARARPPSRTSVRPTPTTGTRARPRPR
jgi:ABC-type xylose transport system substrate-binding protein